MSTPPPPAGWFQDPSGSGAQRYFDGTNWTDHHIPAAVAPRASKPPTGKVVLSLIALFSVVGIVGALFHKTDTVTSSSPATTIPSTMATRSAAEIERERARAASLDPANYPSIDARAFGLLARDPDAHERELLTIYGVVSQFDAATGDSEFRADVAAELQLHAYDYEQNSVVSAINPETVANVVEGDVLKMSVEVGGAYSYDTQIGGSTTVPRFWLHFVENLGSPR